VPYGPHLVLGSEATKEAAKKRKSDAIAGLAGKRVKVSSRKAAPLKASIASESTGADSSKAAAAKSGPMRSLPKAGAAPRASIAPRSGAPMKTVLKAVAMAAVLEAVRSTSKTTLKAGVLRINTRAKRPGVISLQAAKGK
jgi:hypothetical protein